LDSPNNFYCRIFNKFSHRSGGGSSEEKIVSLISAIRNKAIQAAAKSWLQKQTEAVKDVQSLEIDSKQRTFSMKLELAGESEPLTVTGSYQLIEAGGKTVLAPADIQTSKEWLTILAAEQVKGRTFEVPGIVRSFL
jgi:hypothetical protein